ncbi:MAG: M14 family metallopeptidase [Janthinobacterium lividum]
MPLKISQQFDAGAIEVVSADSAATITLKLRADSAAADIAQWFHFRLQGARGQACSMQFLNAAQAAYPNGWENYQAVASYDRRRWFRVPTSYAAGVMTIQHTPLTDSVYYAYFEPYSRERHLDFLGEAAQSPLVRVLDLGQTVQGRDLNMLVIGDESKAEKIWVIARQHPGETMAEWFVEGMARALIEPGNPIARALLGKAVVYLVPNMNPDGSILGNLRTNAAGANLNREWMTPSMESSPEVMLVKNKIHDTGCTMFFDIHGDEGLPYVFVAGSEMLEGFTEAQALQQQTFVEEFKRASPDFQSHYGYGSGKYRADVLKLASKYIGHHFQCLSLTLEMPFKDNAHSPLPEVGWNGQRSAELGRAMLQPVLGACQASKA